MRVTQLLRHNMWSPADEYSIHIHNYTLTAERARGKNNL